MPYEPGHQQDYGSDGDDQGEAFDASLPTTRGNGEKRVEQLPSRVIVGRGVGTTSGHVAQLAERTAHTIKR